MKVKGLHYQTEAQRQGKLVRASPVRFMTWRWILVGRARLNGEANLVLLSVEFEPK
jgi:hypothetical protein